MKELSIEEKAKAYDEAIGMAREWYSDAQIGIGFKANLEKLFPELKESEDEKVRAWLIDTIKQVPNDSIEWDVIDKSSVLSWLEKQGTSYTKRDVDDAYLKGVTDTKNEIEKQYEANYQIRKDISTFIFNYRGDIKDRAKWMDYLGFKVSFVKGQGEKETLCDKCRKEHPSHSCQDITALGRCAVEHEQKPAWSKEDEKMIDDAIGAINAAHYYTYDDKQKIGNWLKSLKQRML